MPKRINIDPVTKAKTEIRRTPQPRDSVRRQGKDLTYTKRNYVKALEIITPDIYVDDDIALSGTKISEVDELINSHILAANTTAVLDVSSLTDVSYLSSIDSITGISQFFIRNNNLTFITPELFERRIMVPLSAAYSDFDGSAQFIDWVSGTLLPSTTCINAANAGDAAVNSNNAFDNTSSGTHKYLIDNLSWFYLLNRPDQAGVNSGWSTSGEISKVLTKTLWEGISLGLEDAMSLFQGYMWNNYPTFSSTDERFIPTDYRSSGAGEFVSGTQMQERLQTLAKVVYSDQSMSLTDKRVSQAFDDFISASALIEDEESAGPFWRFLKAMGFFVADRQNEMNEIETLLDIDSCPDEYLDNLADLIGLKLFGPDATRRRNQLRQAMSVYKAAGTKKSIQYVIDSVFGTSSFDVTGNQLYGLWESYIPNLIYYAIATSSTLTEKGIESFTKDDANRLGLDKYTPKNLDNNIRLSVDRIMWELANEFPDQFFFAGKPFPRPKFLLERDPSITYTGPWNRDEEGNYYSGETFRETVSERLVPTQDPNFTFEYRGRVMPIPPFEDIKYYRNCHVNRGLLEAISYKLTCFGVDASFVDDVIAYIKEHTIENEDTDFYNNEFLFFTSTEKVPSNYGQIVDVVRKDSYNTTKYLPLWNNKSSRFKISFKTSSFDFLSDEWEVGTKFPLANLKEAVNFVAPAHAIPDISLELSSVEDTNVGVSSFGVINIIHPVSSYYDGSANFTSNFNQSAVDMRHADFTFAANAFKREDVDKLDDEVWANNDNDISHYAAYPRNDLRRKNFAKILQDDISLREGFGGNAFGVSSYPGRAADALKKVNLATMGAHYLGYDPSAAKFQNVALRQTNSGFSWLIDNVNINAVWGSCQNHNSSDSFFGVDASDCYGIRGYWSNEAGTPSSNEYFRSHRRDTLSEMEALMHRVDETSRLHEASSIVSGYFNEDGTINSSWPSTDSRITPTTLSSWYVDTAVNVPLSIANQLSLATSSNIDTHYMEDMAFGRDFHLLYRDFRNHYDRHALNFQPWKTGNPNFLSHTYGPYIYNCEFDIKASGTATTAPELVASSLQSSTVIDISYGNNVGVLSENNYWGITVDAITASADMYVQYPEVRCDGLLSGIEFVDTSTDFGAITPNALYTQQNPDEQETFALIELPNTKKQFEGENVDIWSYNRVLEDNLVIKHSRKNNTTLPRLRYKIEPDSSRPDLKNFFVPDSNYTLSIKAFNADENMRTIGGDQIGVWVHTEPISYTFRQADGTYKTEESVWSYVNGQWVRTPLSDITGSQGIPRVASLSLTNRFRQYPITQAINTSVTQTNTMVTTNEVITPYEDLDPRLGCIEDAEFNPKFEILNEVAFETLTFNFDTFNKNVPEDLTNKVHTKDRKYYVEIYLRDTRSENFVVYDKISIVNDTFKEKASITTDYNKYILNAKELKTSFDFFTGLAEGPIQGRDAVTTSGVMDVSGGSRISYRTPLFMEPLTTSDTTHQNFTYIYLTD